MVWFRRSLAVVVVVTFVLAMGAFAMAQDKKDLELKACGPKDKEVDYKTETDKSQHPTPAQPADKALIYVLRPTSAGMKIQTKLAVDGEWKGVNKGNTYFFLTLDPGEHYFCSVSENHSLLTLKVEAGKTYYLQQHIEMGFLKARNRIDEMKEDEGKKKLEKLNFSTWTAK